MRSACDRWSIDGRYSMRFLKLYRPRLRLFWSGIMINFLPSVRAWYWTTSSSLWPFRLLNWPRSSGIKPRPAPETFHRRIVIGWTSNNHNYISFKRHTWPYLSAGSICCFLPESAHLSISGFCGFAGEGSKPIKLLSSWFIISHDFRVYRLGVWPPTCATRLTILSFREVIHI